MKGDVCLQPSMKMLMSSQSMGSKCSFAWLIWEYYLEALKADQTEMTAGDADLIWRILYGSAHKLDN